MAKSIKTQGVINPIEIDKNNRIVTGEIRWRAAKEAGEKVVPCKIIEISKDDRFMRQVIENIHHNTMTTWDTAEALKKLLSQVSGLKREGERYTGATILAEKIGKTKEYISQLLELLDEQTNVVEALKEDKINWTLVSEAKRAPEKLQKEIKDRIVNGELQQAGAHGVRAIANALKTYPDYTEDVMKENYLGKNAQATRDTLKKIIPDFTETPVSDAYSEAIQPATELGNLAIKVLQWARNNPPESIAKFELPRVIESWVAIKNVAKNWMKNKVE